MNTQKILYNYIITDRNLNLFIYSFLCLLILIFFFNGFLSSSKENILYKTILYADAQISEVSVIDQKAESYYQEASFFYEKEDYKNVESNCRLAREYYFDSSQEYIKIKSGLQQSGIKNELINIYIESLEVLSEIRLNMYEACEHFESASRYYDVYYNTNVSYNHLSYDMGNKEIEAMNEKISLHDDNVRKYNNLLGDFRVKLENELK